MTPQFKHSLVYSSDVLFAQCEGLDVYTDRKGNITLIWGREGACMFLRRDEWQDRKAVLENYP